jgi:hypothetical protein
MWATDGRRGAHPRREGSRRRDVETEGRPMPKTVELRLRWFPQSRGGPKTVKMLKIGLQWSMTTLLKNL